MSGRLAVLLALLIATSSVLAQTTLWNQVSTAYRPPKTRNIQLPRAEANAIRSLLSSPSERDIWECGDDPAPEWLNRLVFSPISLASGHKTILIEAGPGCARGGQGSNGALWIVELHGSKPTLLATPKHDFNGWLYSVQPTPRTSYHDVVLGWHMSAFESGLSYFRFDGHSYKLISAATLKTEGDEHGTILPAPVAPETH